MLATKTTNTWEWQKNMMYSRSGFAGCCRKNLDMMMGEGRVNFFGKVFVNIWIYDDDDEDLTWRH